MKFKTKYKLTLWRRYLDLGISITAPIKWGIAYFGMASLDVKLTMIMGITYFLSCFLIGRFWFKHRFVEADHEVTNNFNRFVKEMRKSVERKV